jgi:hypothetical protein
MFEDTKRVIKSCKSKDRSNEKMTKTPIMIDFKHYTEN